MEHQVTRTFTIAAILAVGLIAASCSGSDSDSGVASLASSAVSTEAVEEAQSGETTSEPVSDEEAVLAFATCLRDEGVEVEDPTVDADGNLRPPSPRDIEQGDREAIRSAMEACSEHLEGVAFGLGGADRSEREDQLFEYAACMRENGYNMPDPDFAAFGQPGENAGPGTGGGGPFGEIDRDDPTFQTAQEACADIFGGDRIPGGGPGGRGAGA